MKKFTRLIHVPTSDIFTAVAKRANIRNSNITEQAKNVSQGKHNE